METQERTSSDGAPEQDSPEYREFVSLARQYRRLAWPKSVAEQREKDRLNRELMRLYLCLNPNSPYREWDDFDVVSRGRRTPAA
jgi:hypothetical protein